MGMWGRGAGPEVQRDDSVGGRPWAAQLRRLKGVGVGFCAVQSGT